MAEEIKKVKQTTKKVDVVDEFKDYLNSDPNKIYAIHKYNIHKEKLEKLGFYGIKSCYRIPDDYIIGVTGICAFTKRRGGEPIFYNSIIYYKLSQITLVECTQDILNGIKYTSDIKG